MNREEFIKKIYSRNYVNKMVSKVKLLGSKSNINPYDLMIVRLITSLVLFCLCLYSLDYGYIYNVNTLDNWLHILPSNEIEAYKRGYIQAINDLIL